MVAKYQVIMKDIIQEIHDGVFVPGDKVYSEAELREKYDVSNTTVVKALNNLVSEGYLIRKQGIGTYVRRNLIDRKVLFSEVPLVSSIKGRVVERTETIVSDPHQDPAIAKKLGNPSGKEKIIKIVQIAFLNDTPWKIQNRYLLEKKIPIEGIENIKHGGSVTKEVAGAYNINTDMTINITTLERDSEELEVISRYLQDKYADSEKLAFFDIKKIIKSLDAEVLEYTRSLIDPHFYSIRITTE